MTDGTKRATAHSLKRTLRVCYPVGKGKLVRRTELDCKERREKKEEISHKNRREEKVV